jgi:hypothetical protein
MQITDMVEVTEVTFVSVEEAVRTLQGVAYPTPVPTSSQLDALSDARIFLTGRCPRGRLACLQRSRQGGMGKDLWWPVVFSEVPRMS